MDHRGSEWVNFVIPSKAGIQEPALNLSGTPASNNPLKLFPCADSKHFFTIFFYPPDYTKTLNYFKKENGSGRVFQQIQFHLNLLNQLRRPGRFWNQFSKPLG